eukprot:5386228-Amphidinium_carterae.1
MVQLVLPVLIAFVGVIFAGCWKLWRFFKRLFPMESSLVRKEGNERIVNRQTLPAVALRLSCSVNFYSLENS